MSEVAAFKIVTRTLSRATVPSGSGRSQTRIKFVLEDGRWYHTHWMTLAEVRALLRAKGLNPRDAKKDGSI